MTNGPVCGVICYVHALNDPPARQAAESMRDAGFDVTLIQIAPDEAHPSSGLSGVDVLTVRGNGRGPIRRVWRWFAFRRAVERFVRDRRPSVLIPIMFHAVDAMPAGGHRVVACVYDIPAPGGGGQLGSRIIRRGWAKLRYADAVWASDAHKAELAMQMGSLRERPIVCHNTPPKSYLPEPSWPRDGWLRGELAAAGAPLKDGRGTILLRAGAVGPYGGIEETIGALQAAPDMVFLLMGRPGAAYAEGLLRQARSSGLERRVFLWDRPSDERWKRALAGADLGHLIHGPFPEGPLSEAFRLNSSLSNNRLFQYMAAGLPIVAYTDPRMDAVYAQVDCFAVMNSERLKADLTRVLPSLAIDSERRRQMGQAARRAHLTTYSWEHQFDTVLRRIRSLVGRGAP